MPKSRTLAAACLFATVTSAFAEDPTPRDQVFVAGMEASLRGEVLGFRGSRLEMRTEGVVVRVETRYLRCVRFGSASAVVFEERFPGTEVGPQWEKKSGLWTVKDGVATGAPVDDVAVLELRDQIPGDAVLDLDAEIHTRNPRGGLHVTFGGQHWFLYPRWAGIYPPYQEVDGSMLWSSEANREYSFQGHFRFARTGRHFEFTIDGKPFHQVESTPPEVMEGKLVLCAAHGAVVQYRNLRVESDQGSPVVSPQDFKSPTDIKVWLTGGQTVPGSLAGSPSGDLVATVQAGGKVVPLKEVSCLAFPPREVTEPEFDMDEAFQKQLDRWVAQLGDEDYEKREEASRGLGGAGPLACPSLLRALKSPDPEVTVRAEILFRRLKVGGK